MDDQTKRIRALAIAMLRGYAGRYPSEDFTVAAAERGFTVPIRNPETNAESRSFLLAGKVDLLAGRTSGLWIGEHKTAGQIDAAYIERLWGDFQTTLYAHAIEVADGVQVEGILYNVIAKAKIQQKAGETEDEFSVRRDALIAKSKNGKTTAKRQEPESDEAFAARLAEWYADPAAFHREELIVSRDRYADLATELWELTQMFLDARRRDVWYQNPSQCLQWGHACAYWPICRSCGNPNVVDNLYRPRTRHEELSGWLDGIAEANDGRMLTTYSMWSTFRDCRRRCYWRYIREIVPVERPDEKLVLGNVVHAALARWHTTRDLTETLGEIDRLTNGGDASEPVF